MSLLTDAMEMFRFIDKSTRPDGRGSVEPVWTPGAEFKAALSFDTSTQARRAEKEGVENLYTVTTTRDIPLNYGDIVQRMESERYFFVTSDGEDKKTPFSASLDMRVVSAKELESLPTR